MYICTVVDGSPLTTPQLVSMDQPSAGHHLVNDVSGHHDNLKLDMSEDNVWAQPARNNDRKQ